MVVSIFIRYSFTDSKPTEFESATGGDGDGVSTSPRSGSGDGDGGGCDGDGKYHEERLGAHPMAMGR
ncbi:hypothetical protein M0804_001398 [Polistes exclamans]|nr:hypothetical protein M0804_001398 [Polistes exclamans]